MDTSYIGAASATIECEDGTIIKVPLCSVEMVCDARIEQIPTIFGAPFYVSKRGPIFKFILESKIGNGEVSISKPVEEKVETEDNVTKKNLYKRKLRIRK